MKFFIILSLSLTSYSAQPSEPILSTFKYGNFGTVTVYSGSGTPKNLILFASGDGGWTQGVVDMAKKITEDSTVVVGFNTVTFLKNLDAHAKKCIYPAGELELLSKFIQAKLKFSEYSHPIFVGYSSGATLVYGALVQAPEGTFKGGISLGFCPDLGTKAPLCKGFGLESEPVKKGPGFLYQPSQKNMIKWFALNGDQDQVCALSEIKNFISKTRKANLVKLAKVGHGFSVQKNWMPQFQDVIHQSLNNEVKKIIPDSVSDLPIVELPVENSKSDQFVIFYSGDGGWAEFDQQVADKFVENGIPVVGVNSLKYFWSPKSPEQGGKDLDRIIEYYSSAWKKKSVTLVGFSFGADVAPFFVSRLSSKWKPSIKNLILLGPSKTADFEFHFADWVSETATGQPIQPVLKTLDKKLKVQCFYGEEESSESGCPLFQSAGAEVKSLPGGHHFDASVDQIYQLMSK